MKKYYYTDPLAAAWMAKHFGMKFVYEDEFQERNNIGILGEDNNFNTTISYRNKYFIHPDSLPILEPRDEDFILPADRIIQRSNIAFMWPIEETK